MKQLEATHAMKMKWRMIPAMKSSLKATHAIKGNSKEVSQPDEGFQNIRKDSDRSLGHAQRRKPERHKTKNASIYALSGHERIEKRSDQ